MSKQKTSDRNVTPVEIPDRGQIALVCPNCGEPISIGIVRSQPKVEYALKISDIMRQRDGLVEKIKASSMPQKNKDILIGEFTKEGVVYSPVILDMTAMEISKNFPPKEKREVGIDPEPVGEN
ncbi:MAG: hypothetical protein WC291_12705 [Thermodesulfovibrionales bacterium]|jgi:predicted RNA-binding Zn-ribbon protein involved in translation (DUF1610 family)